MPQDAFMGLAIGASDNTRPTTATAVTSQQSAILPSRDKHKLPL